MLWEEILACPNILSCSITLEKLAQYLLSTNRENHLKTLYLTHLELRRFLLSKHGLWPPRALSGKEGVLAVFDQLACVQFDPLNIIGRNPDLVLQSRVADYRPELLYELMYSERKLYDYWDKMMSIVPIQDWPRLALMRAGWREHHAEQRAKYRRHAQTILNVIRDQGPMSSLDFEAQHDLGWKADWRWGPMRAAKMLLEMLGDTGELMVSRRQGARRYYDLAERVLPDAMMAEPLLLDRNEYMQWRVARRCQGIGLIGPALGGEAWGMVGKAPERARAIEALVEKGELLPLQIEGDERPYHILARDLDCLERVRSSAPPLKAAFIAPLDNLLWSRTLVERLFGFSYVWEVYKPAHQRRYGYYVLPALFGDHFVARFDARLDRDEGQLVFLSWHWECGESLTSKLAKALREALAHFMAYLDVRKATAMEGLDPAVAALVGRAKSINRSHAT